MSTAEAKEKLIKMLSDSAVQRFGEERAKSLYPAIQEIAQSLVSIADCELALEEEPAFFLNSPYPIPLPLGEGKSEGVGNGGKNDRTLYVKPCRNDSSGAAA